MNSRTTLMAMASLPAKPSTGGMFYHVSVCVVMNHCFTEHSKCYGIQSLKRRQCILQETISVQMWESYIIYLTKDLVPSRYSAGIIYSQGLNKRSI